MADNQSSRRMHIDRTLRASAMLPRADDSSSDGYSGRLISSLLHAPLPARSMLVVDAMGCRANGVQDGLNECPELFRRPLLAAESLLLRRGAAVRVVAHEPKATVQPWQELRRWRCGGEGSLAESSNLRSVR